MKDDEIRLKIAEWTGWSNIYGKLLPYAPDWPNSVKFAWELVEEMRQTDVVHLTARNAGNVTMDGRIDETWRCMVKDIQSIADTAPRAICLAYIAWKEAQQSN